MDVSVFLVALNSSDFGRIETLRDSVEAVAEQLVRDHWDASLDRRVKNSWVHLLCDYREPFVQPVMRDGLVSPDPDTRVMAFCCVTGDFDQQDEFYDGAKGVSAERIDAAIAAWLEN
jgi:hypothetical protein